MNTSAYNLSGVSSFQKDALSYLLRDIYYRKKFNFNNKFKCFSSEVYSSFSNVCE